MNILKNFILFLVDLLRNYIHQPRILHSLIQLNIKVAFDVGSHKGETIEYFQKINGINKIHSFEPQVLIYNKLVEKYNFNNKIVLNNLALGSNFEEKNFFINSLSSTSSFSSINKDSLWFKIKKIILNEKDPIKDSIILQTSTIDNYVKNKNINVIDLLKIDTEGYELEVLKGAQKTIDNKKVNYILIEIHFSKMYKDYSKNKIENFLKKNNFTLLKSFQFPFHTFQDNLYKYNRIN